MSQFGCSPLAYMFRPKRALDNIVNKHLSGDMLRQDSSRTRALLFIAGADLKAIIGTSKAHINTSTTSTRQRNRDLIGYFCSE